MIQPCPHRQLLCAPKPSRPRFSPLLFQFLTEPSPWKLLIPLSNPVEPNYSLQLTKFKPSRALSSYPNHKPLPSFTTEITQNQIFTVPQSWQLSPPTDLAITSSPCSSAQPNPIWVSPSLTCAARAPPLITEPCHFTPP
ncbi:hypothetical protein M0R45_019730 [Rubus argutus]|uniref:Uncharacterized protein n=1 Tax=Rubus argutus TaxID=59490 RepID=A0AAW1X6P5_RUBAR